MELYILIPVIAVISICAVAGIWALCNQTENKGQRKNPIEEYTKNVEERTKDLANGEK